MEFQVPVIVEFNLEHATDIAMGTEIGKIREFEELPKAPLKVQMRSPCSVEL